MGLNLNIIPKSISTTNLMTCLIVTVVVFIIVSRSLTGGGFMDAMERKNT